MIGRIAQEAPTGTLGGSALASWTPLWMLAGIFAAIVIALFVVGSPSERRWAVGQPLSRIPNGLTRITGIPGWAAVAVGTSLFGLLVAGQGFYSDVSWHIALGRDDQLMTAPHAGILLGLVMILGAAVLGTLVATFEGVEGIRIGGLRMPRSLIPLWALGIGAVSGFPLDEVWHREYGIDVTMWSPTHMLMILGATFTGMAAWLVLAESGVQARGSRWGRGAHVVCGWLTLQGLLAPQGEFTFGVPQFNLLFSPILVSLAAGIGLVAFRLVHGRWWTIGLVVVNFAIQATGFLDFGAEDEGPVDTRFGATFILSGIWVELVARIWGTEDRTRFALLSGLGIGTVGLAGEQVWNSDAWQPWTSSLYPEVVALALVASVAAALLGTAFARAIASEQPRRAVPGSLLVLAALASVAVVLIPMRRPTGDVEVSISLEEAGEGQAFVTAALSPAEAADDAYWFQATAWQGGGLELGEMEPTGEAGVYRSDQPMPIDGLWKTLLRLHRGNEMMAAPVYLPEDEEIGEPEIPAEGRTIAFSSEREFLLRETTEGNGWLSPVVHGLLVSVAAAWAGAFVVAVRYLTPRTRPPATGSDQPVGQAVPVT